MISLLAKLPFVSNVFRFVTGKKRLAIEYGLIAVLIAVAGFTVNLWLSKLQTERDLLQTKTDLHSVKTRLVTVESISESQAATINDLRELRFKDARSLTGLLDDYKALSLSDARARKRLDSLEKSNEAVRTYLDQRIPPDLVCLLDGTCSTASGDPGSEGDRAPGSAKGTNQAVPPRTK